MGNVTAIRRVLLCSAFAVVWLVGAWGGGGPQNVLVVVNARSSDSLEIGNAYRRARNIPYCNMMTLDTAPVATISTATYLSDIESPIRKYITANALESQITDIVLTRGFAVDRFFRGHTLLVAGLLSAMDLPAGTSITDRLKNPYLDFPSALRMRLSRCVGCIW